MKIFKVFICLFLIAVININSFAYKVDMDSGVLKEENSTQKQTITQTQTKNNDEITIEQPNDEYFAAPVTLPQTKYQYPSEKTEQETFVRRTYNASFKAYTDDGIGDYIDVTVLNLNTNQSFSYRLFKTNKYFKVVELPAGEYELISGSVANDSNNKYPVETVYFTVGKLLNVFVPFNVGNPKEPYSHKPEELSSQGYELPEYETEAELSTEKEVIETTITNNNNDNEAAKKNKNGIFQKTIPALIIIIIFVIYIFRKKQNLEVQADNDTRL